MLEGTAVADEDDGMFSQKIENRRKKEAEEAARVTQAKLDEFNQRMHLKKK